MAQHKNIVFISTGKYLQIFDIFYGVLLHNKAEQCHYYKTAHIILLLKNK
jgi:hypothetical protein